VKPFRNRSACLLAAFAMIEIADAAPLPDRVTFASADGQTTLVGYVFKPEGPQSQRTPAVVMMHGRAGAYSSATKGHL
jgi:dipeptidyl aminopeptidase/acylaminoacyl peptidase